MKERLDALRPSLGAVFLAAYFWATFAPRSVGASVFVGVGVLLYIVSLPWSSRFHRGLALVAFAALAAVMVSGKFDAGELFGGLPSYFGIVAVLLTLSIAGYPLRAKRFTAQIRSLVAATTRRGASLGATAGVLGHVLGAVLDVGAFVLVDVLARRGAPKERVRIMTWASRSFSFAPLWTNLNVFTATTISLTAVSYQSFLAVTLPFALAGLAVTLLFAQRENGEDIPASEPLDRGSCAVLLYPVLLVAAVAVVSLLLPGLALTATVALTVTVVVIFIALCAGALSGRRSPLSRLVRETRESLTGSHAEFALFGSAGILVLSLNQLGVLAPVGALLSLLPSGLVAPALLLVMAVGFVAGIHVIPLVLLLNAAFPLSEVPAPALAAAAIMLGAQSAILLTPFSNAVTMLARLSGMHPLEIGPRLNWKFSLAVTVTGLLYLGLLTPLFL